MRHRLLLRGIGLALLPTLIPFTAISADRLPTLPESLVQSTMRCASRVSALPMVSVPEARIVPRSDVRYQPTGGERVYGQYQGARVDHTGKRHPAVIFLANTWQEARQNILAHELVHHLQAEHGIDPLLPEAEAAADRVGAACS